LLRARDDRSGFELIAEGRLRLTAEGLEIGDGEQPSRLAHAELVAVSVELGNQVELRTEEGLYRLELSKDRVLEWGCFSVQSVRTSTMSPLRTSWA
jgi:hypothetical protein